MKIPARTISNQISLQGLAKEVISNLDCDIVRLSVLVRQGSGPIEEREGTLVVYTTEKRKNNRANLDVIKQLSRRYSVQSSFVRIVAGASSNKKIVELIERE